MRSTDKKKLTLAAQTIRALDLRALQLVAGGATYTCTSKYKVSVGFCE